MTLGELITALEAADPTQVVRRGFHNPHSYRGDYMDLAFEAASDVTVADMLADARSALGATFTGWKGGDFTMAEHTDCWLAQEGCLGETIGPLLLELMVAAPAIVQPAPADAASSREHDLIEERDKLARWHREDGKALGEMRATIQRLRVERDELIRQRDQIAMDTVKAIVAPPADRAAILREAAAVVVRENERCPAVGPCPPCEARDRAATDLRSMAVWAQQSAPTAEPECTCGAAGEEFRPAGHYRDCPEHAREAQQPAPADQPRRFYLQRHHDVTGISGTGRVADGILWPDGTASVRWRGSDPSTVSWDRGRASVERIHGHGGATEIIWIDEAPAGLAASTTPLAAGLPHVQGRCPACGTAGLFLGDGGYVTCSRSDCPEPDAASTVLEQVHAERDELHAERDKALAQRNAVFATNKELHAYIEEVGRARIQAENEARTLRRRIGEAEAQQAKQSNEVVHGCPPDGSGLTPCCGRTPIELPLTDRISSEAPTTCPGTGPR